MTIRFLYFYLMRDAPDLVREAGPRHAEYWRRLSLPGYLGGPFSDRSGGLITFEAGSQDEAQKLVGGDPFIDEDLLDRHWLKEWAIE